MAKRQGSLADRFSKFEQKKTTPQTKVKQDTGYTQKVVRVPEQKTKSWKNPEKEYDRVHIVIEKDVWKKVKLSIIESEEIRYESEFVNLVLNKFFSENNVGDLSELMDQ